MTPSSSVQRSESPFAAFFADHLVASVDMRMRAAGRVLTLVSRPRRRALSAKPPSADSGTGVGQLQQQSSLLTSFFTDYKLLWLALGGMWWSHRQESQKHTEYTTALEQELDKLRVENLSHYDELTRLNDEQLQVLSDLKETRLAQQACRDSLDQFHRASVHADKKSKEKSGWWW